MPWSVGRRVSQVGQDPEGIPQSLYAFAIHLAAPIRPITSHITVHGMGQQQTALRCQLISKCFRLLASTVQLASHIRVRKEIRRMVSSVSPP